MDIFKYKEKIDKANREGFAGCMPNGNLVDRRENPEALPVAENRIFEVTAPRCIGCEKVTPMFELQKSLCKDCRAKVPICENCKQNFHRYETKEAKVCKTCMDNDILNQAEESLAALIILAPPEQMGEDPGACTIFEFIENVKKYIQGF